MSRATLPSHGPFSSPEAVAFTALLADAKRRPREPIHGFHRWFGKLIPAIPAAAIDAYTLPGDLVVDPFCGSGTVLVEARRAGRRAWGSDVNPLATLLSRVKTRTFPPGSLEHAAERVRSRFAANRDLDWERGLPEVPNRRHFYPDPVARDLFRLLEAARAEEETAVREYFEAVVSAINRDVSNADTRHVFPGVSKRMRALIAEGWTADVPARFDRALRRRLRASASLAVKAAGAPAADVVERSAEESPLPPGSAALVVTNPPYVSSIRYVETFKLEAAWLGLCPTRDALRALDARTLGTERLPPGDSLEDGDLEHLPSELAEAALALADRGEHRLARVVATFAAGFARSLEGIARVLRPGGHAVLKLAPSRLRGVVLPTPSAAARVLEAQGLELVGAIDDRYSQTSRSLTLARNWYSGRMDADVLLVFRSPPPSGADRRSSPT